MKLNEKPVAEDFSVTAPNSKIFIRVIRGSKTKIQKPISFCPFHLMSGFSLRSELFTLSKTIIIAKPIHHAAHLPLSASPAPVSPNFHLLLRGGREHAFGAAKRFA